MLSSLWGGHGLEIALYEKSLWWKYNGCSAFQHSLSLTDFITDFLYVPIETVYLEQIELESVMLREYMGGNRMILLLGDRGCPVISYREQDTEGRYQIQTSGSMDYQNSHQEDKHHMLLTVQEIRKLFRNMVITHTSMAAIRRSDHSMTTQTIGK